MSVSPERSFQPAASLYAPIAPHHHWADMIHCNGLQWIRDIPSNGCAIQIIGVCQRKVSDTGCYIPAADLLNTCISSFLNA